MRCETCLLTSEEGGSLKLDTFLDRLESCDDCPIESGQEPCPQVAIERLVLRGRASARALRKLGNKLRLAEQAAKDLTEGIADYEDHAAKLEALQQASILEANRELADKMALVVQKEESILALSTPIIEVWKGVLVLPIIGRLDDRRTSVMLSTLLDKVAYHTATHAVLDLTGVDQIDAATADQIVRICRTVALLGAEVILCGIRVEVVAVLIDLQLDLSSIGTVRNLKEALRRCGVGAARR